MRLVTVKMYQALFKEHVRPITKRTIRTWIQLGKLKARRDPGGQGWLIELEKGDTLHDKLIYPENTGKERKS